MEVVSARNLVIGVALLVTEILLACKDVQSLPETIDQLLQTVERLKEVDQVMKQVIEPKSDISQVQHEERLFKPPLSKLGEVLALALMEVEKFEKQSQKQHSRHKAWEIAKAVFQHGAAKQNVINNITAVCQAIEEQREELQMAQTLCTYSIITRTPLPFGSGKPKPSSIVNLDGWARECRDHSNYSVNVLTAEGDSNDFGVDQYYPYRLKTKDGIAFFAKLTEGGRVVKNQTKVQFQIDVQELCFFYVLSYETGLTIDTNLELIFPKYAAYKNEIIARTTRKFPDSTYNSDPWSCVVGKDSSVGVQMGRVFVYIVLSAEPLEQVGRKEVGIDHIMEQLNSKVAKEDFYVKRLVFDVL